jgi:hypothetical protein
MKQTLEAKDQVIALSAMKIQKLEEELRLERIRKYGKQSVKLSDLQLQLLDLEPAVSSEEVAAESSAARCRSRPRTAIRPTRNSATGRIIRAATSCPRILNGSTRSSLVRPSFAVAASAVPIRRSSVTKFRKCSSGSRLPGQGETPQVQMTVVRVEFG